MKFYLKVVCKSFSQNQADNTLSIFEMFERMQPQALPLVIAPFNVIFLSTKEDEDSSIIPIQIEIRNNNNILGTVDANIDYQSHTKNRFILQIPGLVVPEAGELTFRLNYTDHRGTGHEIITVVIDNPPIQ